MKNIKAIDEKIKSTENELAVFEAKGAELKKKIEDLERRKHSIVGDQVHTPQIFNTKVTNESSEKEKIALFRSLLRGREDVFPSRFESVRSGKSGYQPSCRNEWKRGICRKPKIKCADCDERDFFHRDHSRKTGTPIRRVYDDPDHGKTAGDWIRIV